MLRKGAVAVVAVAMIAAGLYKIGGLRISRDGSKLFYTRGRRTGDIFILHLGTRAGRKAGG